MTIGSIVKNVKSIFKAAKSGCYTWSEYSEPGNHDHKFGPTVTEYLSQIPYLCIITMPLVLIWWLIYYGSIALYALVVDGGAYLLSKLRK